MHDTALDYLKEVETLLDIFIAAYDFSIEVAVLDGKSKEQAEIDGFVTPRTIDRTRELLEETRVRVRHIEASKPDAPKQRMGGQNHQWRSRRGRL